jgi:transcriptional regulator with XRE-family HTH domain
LSTFSNQWAKLSASKEYREHFAAQFVKQFVPFQLRTLMKAKGLSQSELAERSGLTQGVISRAASPEYGNLTFNTCLRIGAGLDMVFLGRWVSFKEAAKFFDTMSEESVVAPSFDEESESVSMDLAWAEVDEQLRKALTAASKQIAEHYVPKATPTLWVVQVKPEQQMGLGFERTASRAVLRAVPSGTTGPNSVSTTLLAAQSTGRGDLPQAKAM